MEPTHEIFHKPFAVNPTYTDYPTPKNYLRYYLGKDLGPTMKVWRVQKKGYLEDKDTPPGMVAFGMAFGDSPDAEAMARGINTKSSAAVSIGRHANFLLWGFSASPTDMTEEGRKAFLNCVCYIKKFDGERPLLIDKRDTLFGVRGYALDFALRVTDPGDHKGDMRAYWERSMKRSLAPELLPRFGYDKSKWIDYFERNLDYLRPRSRDGKAPDGRRDLSFVVDEDAKKLGIPTGDPRMLDACVKILEKGGDEAMARRLLTRYTAERFETAGEWRKWLDTNRDRLFFTERSGFRFFFDPRPASQRRRGQNKQGQNKQGQNKQAEKTTSRQADEAKGQKDLARKLAGAWRSDQGGGTTICFSGDRCVFSQGFQQVLFSVEYESADRIRRKPGAQSAILKEQVILDGDRMTLRYPGGNEVSYVRLGKVPEMGTVDLLVLGKRQPDAAELEALKKELIVRRKREQDIRKEIGAAMSKARREAKSPEELQRRLGGGKVREIGKRMREIDTDNTRWLLKLIKDIGWIDTKRFGPQAAGAAFLIVQHSGNLRLMRTALPLLEAEAREQPKNLGRRFAMLFDRTVIALGERQLYGTQLIGGRDGILHLQKLREPDKVDELRAKFGMEPLEKYLDRFRQRGQAVRR